MLPKGFKFTEESKRKMSMAKRGKPLSEETKRKLSSNTSARRPDVRAKMSIAAKNRPCNRKGEHHSEETKKRLSEINKGLKTGEKNPYWKGGTSFYPYCWKFNNGLKEKIRERDNRTCQLCGRTEKENLQLWKEKLCMHHVHYDKPNCKPDLMSLCKKCSSVVNFNRDYYENLFMQKLKERGLA